jgi:hypothetical protein
MLSKNGRASHERLARFSFLVATHQEIQKTMVLGAAADLMTRADSSAVEEGNTRPYI